MIWPNQRRRIIFGCIVSNFRLYPEYAGAEPIKQALSNNEKEIILSAHFLDPQIDAGGTISTMSHPVNYDNNSSLEENIQRLRDEITPLFSKLTFQTLKKLENNNQNKYA